jgi:D-alanyl-D-alanine carboxypeptidase
MATDGDPTAIRSLAITVEDVVAALELNRTTAQQAVLRVTPPFSGRMRARLHVVDDENSDAEVGAALHVDPDRLLADQPTYPTAVETEEALREDPSETYSVDRHHEYHLDAVADWREAVADAIRDRATVQTPAGPHEVAVNTLGDLSSDEPPKQDENSR